MSKSKDKEYAPLPNFSWLLAGKVAGSSKPGATNKIEDDLCFLSEQSIRAILNLCHAPHPPELLRKYHLITRHVPIADFSAPDFTQIERSVSFIERHVQLNEPVLVHCRAGYGRTGTILACYLVQRGMSPAQAISEVRHLRPGSIEVKGQLRAIELYYRKIHSHFPLPPNLEATS
jgi:atypical dual specificity phosphatase